LPPPSKLTPAGLARTLSDGRWRLPRHLDLLNRKLVDVAAGRIKRLMIFMPPRHGKSEFASHYFPAWFLGTFPEKRVILASYEASFAGSWGRKVREAVTEANARGIFPVRVSQGNSSVSDWGLEKHDGKRWRTTSGGMVTAGAGGAITGRGFGLGIIDDPTKNSEEAQSPVYREKLWDWYNSTFATRAEPDAAQVIIETRWHQDDLAGRVLANAEEPWEVVSFPAIAEEEDVLGRQLGEALWPERYSVDALDLIRRERGSHWWSAMYQQRPSAREGGFFKRAWFKVIPEAPYEVTGRVRYWDKAATEGGGDWTVGVLMSRTPDGAYVVEDVRRGQWSSGSVKQNILETASSDGKAVKVVMEQEPGSSGKDSIADYRMALQGYTFRGDPVSGSKQVRADPLASQAEGENVRLVRAPWNDEFIEELCAFDKGAHDDQVDAASGAFGALYKRNTGTSRLASATAPPRSIIATR